LAAAATAPSAAAVAGHTAAPPLPPGDEGSVKQAALREPARAAADWRGGKAAAVAARKAAAPPEVRTVLDGGLDAIFATEEHKRVARAVADWLVGAHAAAHDDPATKRLARLVLGVQKFATNMSACGVWDEPYKAGLRRVLDALGAPLAAAYAAEGLRAALGALTLPPHALVAADAARCAAARRPHKLRCDIPGIVPLLAAWRFNGGDPAARQSHERVFTHMLKMLAMALNERFHATMREVLGPHVVAGEGVMAQNKDGSWRLTPEKGLARMECKRVTDHAPESGCRPSFDIDVLRVLAVCRTADKVKQALQALGAWFDGCGRVKNGFATDDAKAAAGFHLRAIMGNFVFDFALTYAQLAREPAVSAMWQQYAECSPPEGGAPRGRWRAEAAAALAVLTGVELAAQPVRFICEAQIVLQKTYAVRAKMHEP